jgi:hypothetical protein
MEHGLDGFKRILSVSISKIRVICVLLFIKSTSADVVTNKLQ